MTLPRGLAAYPITPSDESGRVDTSALRYLVGRLRDAKVNAIGLLGSTGSYPYLTRDERRRAVEAARDEVGTQIPIIVGIGSLRTDQVVKLAQDARSAGAAAGLLAAVSYQPLTEDEVFDHFATVARESRLPICIYDNPATSHFRFTDGLLRRLFEVDGVVALKSPAMPSSEVADHLASLRKFAPRNFSLGYSGDWSTTDAMVAGADVWHSVLGGIFPEICLRLTAAAQSGNLNEARRLGTVLAPLWELFREFSSVRTVYAIAEHLGLNRTSLPKPVQGLSADVKKRLHSVLAQLPEDFTR